MNLSVCGCLILVLEGFVAGDGLLQWQEVMVSVHLVRVQYPSPYAIVCQKEGDEICTLRCALANELFPIKTELLLHA